MNELFEILMKFYWLVNQVFDPTPLPRYLQGRPFHTQYMAIAERGKWQVRVNFKQMPSMGKFPNIEPTVTGVIQFWWAWVVPFTMAHLLSRQVRILNPLSEGE